MRVWKGNDLLVFFLGSLDVDPAGGCSTGSASERVEVNVRFAREPGIPAPQYTQIIGSDPDAQSTCTDAPNIGPRLFGMPDIHSPLSPGQTSLHKSDIVH